MRKLFKKKASNTGFSYRTKCESLLEQFFYLRKIVKQTVYLSCPGFFLSEPSSSWRTKNRERRSPSGSEAISRL